MATTSRKTEKGKSSKLPTEGENLVSQTRFVTVRKIELKEEMKISKVLLMLLTKLIVTQQKN